MILHYKSLSMTFLVCFSSPILNNNLSLLTLPSSQQVVESEEDELFQTEEEEESEEGDQFDVISLYSERATVSNLGSSGTGGAVSVGATPGLLLLTAALSWG